MARDYRLEGENLTFSDTVESKWENAESAIRRAHRADLLQNGTILDIGGGTGELSSYLNKKGGCTCVSVDYNRTIRKKESALQVLGDAEQLPFGDESFDIVYEKGMFDTRIYYINWKKIIPEIHRVLKSRGILCIAGGDRPPDSELESFFTLINPGKSLPIWEKK